MKISSQSLNAIEKEIFPDGSKSRRSLVKSILSAGIQSYNMIFESEVRFSRLTINALENEAGVELELGPILVMLIIEAEEVEYALNAQLKPENQYDKNDKSQAWFEGTLGLDGEVLYASYADDA